MGTLIDITGQQFGKLTVIERAGTRNKQSLWRCKCTCGNETLSISNSLRDGKSQSCGCTRIEHLINNPPKKTHGGSGDRLFRIWRGMHDRCYYPSHNRYQNYGARGILICDEWKNDYEAFRDWACAAGYDPKAKRGQCTIDRIDVNGNYSPNNCRWVTMKVQANNKTNTREANNEHQ